MKIRCLNCGDTNPDDPPKLCQRLYADGFLTFFNHEYEEVLTDVERMIKR